MVTTMPRATIRRWSACSTPVSRSKRTEEEDAEEGELDEEVTKLVEAGGEEEA